MLATRNPRTGESDHDMPVFDAEQVAAVAHALRQAQPAWAALPLADRLARLAQLADAMVADATALADAIAAYERGTALRRHGEARLAGAEARVEAIGAGADGGVAAKPFREGG